MAAAAYLLANGSRLYADLAGGSTYAEIMDCTEIGSPGAPEGPDIDVTPLAADTAYREFARGLLVAGEFSFKQHFTAARYAALVTPRDAKTAVAWRPSLPDNATPASASRWAFPGYIKSLTIDPLTNPDDPVLISCTVKLTGAVVFTSAS